MLDVSGPLEVFGRTNRWLRDEKGCRANAYDLALIARRAGPLTTSSGLQLVATHSTRNAWKEFDTLLVAGGPGADDASSDVPLVTWLRGAASRVRRLGSVCTGALILAAAGLLDGKRAHAGRSCSSSA